MKHELSRPGDAEELYALLTRRVGLYAGLDHSSVPTALAEELFASVAFTLEQGGSAPGGLEERFEAGLAATRRKLEYGKQLWQAARDSLPLVENLSLRSTVKGIGGFWRRYDYRFFAHQIPCDIDYQLCRPVGEALQGVDYVNAYLERLCMENDFLSRFDPRYVKALLTVYCKDYRGLLINLYEPAAVNALGLALVGGDLSRLNITAEQRGEIGRVLDREGPERLAAAAEKLAALLDLRPKAAGEYLRGLAGDLAPRLRTADLSGIFLTFD